MDEAWERRNHHRYVARRHYSGSWLWSGPARHVQRQLKGPAPRSPPARQNCDAVRFHGPPLRPGSLRTALSRLATSAARPGLGRIVWVRYTKATLDPPYGLRGNPHRRGCCAHRRPHCHPKACSSHTTSITSCSVAAILTCDHTLPLPLVLYIVTSPYPGHGRPATPATNTGPEHRLGWW